MSSGLVVQSYSCSVFLFLGGCIKAINNKIKVENSPDRSMGQRLIFVS